MVPDATGTRVVDAVKRSCELLRLIQERNGAGITELADHSDLSKGSIHTHLSTLKKHGYVRKRNGIYHLGFEFIRKSNHINTEVVSIYPPAKEQLVKLANETGEYVQLMVETDGRGIYLEKIGGENAVGSDYRIGEKWPLHCSAAGKAILSQLEKRRVAEIVAEYGLVQQTDNTIGTEEELFDELTEIRKRGYSYNREETAKGIRAVGTPVSVDQDVLGAISVSGPTARMQGERFQQELPEKLQSAANMVEINLRYQRGE